MEVGKMMVSMRPVRKELLLLNLPFFSEEEANIVKDTVLSTYVSGDGPKCREFEDKLAKYLGVKHAFFTNSCTAALHLALMANNIYSGNIVVPNYTFTSTALVGLLNNVNPILCDVDNTFCNISVDEIQQKINSSTKAIMPVHYAGMACQMDEINKIAKEKGCLVIEDAAHAIGAEYKGKKLGAVSDVGCFSFHGTKNLVCGEGGALVTDNDDIAEKVVIMREKGTNKKAYTSQNKSGYFEYCSLGNSYVQSNILGALALEQLKKLDFMNNLRKKHSNYLLKELEDVKGIQLPSIPKDCNPNWHIFSIRVPSKVRDKFIASMMAEKIMVNIHYKPLHMNSLYRGFCKNSVYENSEKIYDSLVRLPMYPGLTKDDLDDMVEAVKKVMGELNNGC